MARRRKGAELDPGALAFRQGLSLVSRHPLFAPLAGRAWISRPGTGSVPENGWAVVTSSGAIYCHPKRRGTSEEWAWVIAHALLHLAFEHVKPKANERAWNTACCVYVSRFLADLKFGRPPEGLRLPDDARPKSEEALYRQFLATGIPRALEGLDLAAGQGDMLIPTKTSGRRSWALIRRREDWPELFARGLSEAVSGAVAVAAGRQASLAERAPLSSSGTLAREWFIARYPLLGALAASFKIIEDADLCRRLNIQIAAVDASLGELYLNPRAGLDEEETRFVMAHELLHVALNHHGRRMGRDPFLWNCAADYVINRWLIEMKIGRAPNMGLLHDAELAGLSAEEIYDRLARDLRRYRRLMTFRATGMGDIIDRQPPEWWLHGRGLELDEFYRNALSQGFLYHEEQGRGFLPAGLVEEIRALMQPPIAWDVKLAHWFDEHFPPLERVRSYARPSRRQASTPSIPRPSWYLRPEDRAGRTFGVVLDTSMSMSPTILGKALGAIASYSAARDVQRIRLVYVDAAPYDEGYVDAERLLENVQVKGRGGTVLQPAIDLLERADDFPTDAPILVITDGECDRLRIRREHAFILPPGGVLPFSPVGPVFRVV